MQLFMATQTMAVSIPHAMPALFESMDTRKPESPNPKREAKATKPVRLEIKSHPPGSKALAIQGIPISPLND